MCVLMATVRWAGKEIKEVFVHALNFPKILEIGNYPVIPIQLLHHNVRLALQCLYIF